ncbi:hypothetical protein [Kutzneria sp. CA-103260]|uniref:hypothetical protein n=1 Tax=Kutzneria sp. CA-103260 TaxID=2802641 RepID=UPI001BAA3CA0|nr:hypothetical protein [Kutzneria sp. CA-103260]QUQ68297.1 hypothetical protein JJ691_60420 [Kutzneria sp. CA-103260]
MSEVADTPLAALVGGVAADVKDTANTAVTNAHTAFTTMLATHLRRHRTDETTVYADPHEIPHATRQQQDAVRDGWLARHAAHSA